VTQDKLEAYDAKHPAKKQVGKLCWLPYHLLCYIVYILRVHRPSLLSAVAWGDVHCGVLHDQLQGPHSGRVGRVL
jgi:hypothetical protein